MRFSPNAMNPVIVSCGWDKVVKVRYLFRILYLPPPSNDATDIFATLESPHAL